MPPPGSMPARRARAIVLGLQAEAAPSAPGIDLREGLADASERATTRSPMRRLARWWRLTAMRGRSAPAGPCVGIGVLLAAACDLRARRATPAPGPRGGREAIPLAWGASPSGARTRSGPDAPLVLTPAALDQQRPWRRFLNRLFEPGAGNAGRRRSGRGIGRSATGHQQRWRAPARTWSARRAPWRRRPCARRATIRLPFSADYLARAAARG